MSRRDDSDFRDPKAKDSEVPLGMSSYTPRPGLQIRKAYWAPIPGRVVSRLAECRAREVHPSKVDYWDNPLLLQGCDLTAGTEMHSDNCKLGTMHNAHANYLRGDLDDVEGCHSMILTVRDGTIPDTTGEASVFEISSSPAVATFKYTQADNDSEPKAVDVLASEDIEEALCLIEIDLHDSDCRDLSLIACQSNWSDPERHCVVRVPPKWSTDVKSASTDDGVMMFIAVSSPLMLESVRYEMKNPSTGEETQLTLKPNYQALRSKDTPFRDGLLAADFF